MNVKPEGEIMDWSTWIYTNIALWAGLIGALGWYFGWLNKKRRAKIETVARKVLYISTVIVICIALITGYILFKNNSGAVNSITPFKDGVVSVLVLSLDALNEEAKTESISKAVFKNLNKKINENNINDFKIKYYEPSEYPSNIIDARNIGKKYNSTIIVWGDKWIDRSVKNQTKANINYALTEPDKSNKIQSVGSTGMVVTNAGRIYDGHLIANVNYITDFLLGLYYFEKSDLENAILYFKSSIDFVENQNNDFLLQSYFYLGTIYNNRTEFENAINYFNKTLAIDSSFTKASLNLAITYFHQGQTAKANKIFTEILKKQPKTAEDFKCKGIAQTNLGYFDSALVSLNKAIDLDSTDHTLYIDKAQVYAWKAEHPKGFKPISKAIKLNPDDFATYLVRANLYFNTKQLDKALEDINKAISLNKRSFIGFIVRSSIYGVLGNYEKSINDVETAMKLNPNSSLVFNNRANLSIVAGNLKEALNYINKAIELNPKNSNAYINRAAIYEGLKDYSKMIDDCNKAIDLNPKNGIAYFNKACAYSLMDNKKDFLIALNKALELNVLNFTTIETIRNTPEFSKMKDDPDFLKILSNFEN